LLREDQFSIACGTISKRVIVREQWRKTNLEAW